MVFCAQKVGVPTVTAQSVADIAAQEVQKRQAQVEAAQKLFTAGSQSLSNESFGEAVEQFRLAFQTLPDAPALSSMRSVFFQRYARATESYTQGLIDDAYWDDAEKVLDRLLKDARDSGLPVAVVPPTTRKMLADLKARDKRYNFARSPQHEARKQKVSDGLLIGRGYIEIGDYDRAERAFNRVLAVDPYNEAARRGMEQVERHRMDYYDAARDHTRSKMLREIAESWETPVPQLDIAREAGRNIGEVAEAGSARIRNKLGSMILPRIEFSTVPLQEALEFLSMKTRELDQLETNPALRGISFLIDGKGDAAFGTQPITLSLSNTPLEAVLKYTAEIAGARYEVDEFAIRFVPASSPQDEILETRNFIVPPNFLTNTTAGASATVANNPFEAPSDAGGTTFERVTAQSYLENSGVSFQGDAFAQYSAATNKLIVRNTPDQLDLVANLVRAAIESGNKLVEVGVRLMRIDEADLESRGIDWTLGQFNLGDAPRVFAGGGTVGNGNNFGSADSLPIRGPSGQPIGSPVTAGLRFSNVSNVQSIEDVLVRAAPTLAGTSRPPGVFGIAGVFTDPQFSATLRALNQMKSTDVLYQSKVVVSSGERASIRNVREFIYPSEYDPPEIPNQLNNVIGFDFGLQETLLIGELDTGLFPATPATPTAFETRNLGQLIEIEPIIAADNRTVNVRVLLDFSEFVGFINYGTPITSLGNFSNFQPVTITENRILMPVFEAVKETTSVSVWDGQTILIGGLHGQSVSKIEDKIPFVGDLPGIGRAFRSTVYDSKKDALLVFLSVRLIDSGGNPLNQVVEQNSAATSSGNPLIDAAAAQ